MTIPKEAIEKAIEGGWDWHAALGFPNDAKVTDTEHLGRIFWPGIVVSSSFWQSLGKALGWHVKGEWETNFGVDGWIRNARRFYDLIITGGDTDAYWKEILKI